MEDIKTLKTKEFWLSFLLLLIVSLLGKYISTFPGASLIGHLVIALIIGMLLQFSSNLKKVATGGSSFISNKFLRLGIILLGFRLNLYILQTHGIKTLLLAIVVIIFAIAVIYFISNLFKVEKKLALLSGCGCGICGAAAVLGLAPTIKCSKDDEVIAVAVVAILGTLFTLVIVGLKPILGLTEVQYGVLAGGSLHEIAHAVAAGNAGGVVSEEIATIVKLSRVLMLAPLSIILSIILSKNKPENEKANIVIPWFMVGFIIASAIGTYANLGEEIIEILISLAYIFLGMAMAALGVNVNFKVVLEKGKEVFFSAFIGSVLLLILVYFIARTFF